MLKSKYYAHYTSWMVKYYFTTLISLQQHQQCCPLVAQKFKPIIFKYSSYKIKTE